MERVAVNEPVPFEFTQLLDQHLLADAWHQALEFTEAPRLPVDLPEDHGLPLATDHFEEMAALVKMLR